MPVNKLCSSGTNVCAWINHHVGVTIAAVGGTGVHDLIYARKVSVDDPRAVTLLVLLAVSLCYVCRRGRRRVSPVMRYAPRDQPRVNGRQISAPLPAEHLSSHEPESYVFSVPGESQWQSSEAWTDVDLSKSSARAREQCGQ